MTTEHFRAATESQQRSAARSGGSRWFETVLPRIFAADTAAIAAAIVVTHALWIRPGARVVTSIPGHVTVPPVPYPVLSLGLGIAWLVALSVVGSRRRRVIGSGPDEYRMVIQGSFWLFGCLAAACYVGKVDVARGYLAMSFPLGVVFLLFGRWTVRKWLHVQRVNGRLSSEVLLVGGEREVSMVTGRLAKKPQAGLTVVDTLVGIHDSLASPAVVEARATALGVRAVVICQSAHYEPAELNELRWKLEESGTDLVIAPSVHGIGGGRVHARPVDGVPLLHVEGASYEGGMRFVKTVTDKALSALGLVLLAPVFAVTAVLVKATSAGPVFYRQERVGLNGRTFMIWKFRSMRADADAQLMAKLAEQGTDGQPLFKVSSDDRITPIGTFLRKWSIDELPQLLNVFMGEMSLVGPRPQRPAEVALYTGSAARRLKSKPGITGLWQVSGRSDLPWEEAVQLDLYYVENWSVLLDLVLLLKTFGAVMRGRGAY